MTIKSKVMGQSFVNLDWLATGEMPHLTPMAGNGGDRLFSLRFDDCVVWLRESQLAELEVIFQKARASRPAPPEQLALPFEAPNTTENS